MSETKALSFDDIAAADDLSRRERVECPEWGGHVYVRTLTALERDQWESSMVQTRQDGRVDVVVGKHGVRARWAALVMCDANGVSLVNTPSQIDQLSKKSAAPLDRVWDAGRKLNRMSTGSEDDDAKN